MIKIIKEGTRKKYECENCGCLFSYEKEDIKTITSDVIDCYINYIRCPQCGYEIKLKSTK